MLNWVPVIGVVQPATNRASAAGAASAAYSVAADQGMCSRKYVLQGRHAASLLTMRSTDFFSRRHEFD